MPKKSTGASSGKSKRKTSKSGKRNTRIKKKQRDRFITTTLIISAAAITLVAVTNLIGFGNTNNGTGALIPPENAANMETYTDKDKLCRFDFIDVGQGDSTLITTPNKEYILVDTGTSSSDKLMKHLEVSKVNEIDYLVLSHPHNDHIGGAVDVLEKYDVKNVIMPDAVSGTTMFEKLYEALAAEKEAGCKIYSAVPGDVYSIDNCTMNIIGPMEIDEDELNNCSACFVFSYGEYDALFTGDAEKKMEEKMISSGAKLDCELYKVAHHGSDTSSCMAFVNAVTPEVSVVSCGKGNTYGHPSTEIVQRLYDAGSSVYVTSELGTVTVLTDGDGYFVGLQKK